MHRYIKDTILFFALLWAIPIAQAFDSLDQAKVHAAHLQEFPVVRYLDVLTPDYSSLYFKLVPPWWKKVLYNAGVLTHPAWTAQNFKALLEQVTDNRELAGNAGSYALEIEPPENSEFILVSNIAGSFHSLMRILGWLNQSNIIDNSFKILPANTYFVFDGNSINSSPYNLEVLTIILTLMKNNGNKVLHIKGKQETETYWQNYGLKKELQIRAHAVDPEHEIPLNNLIIRFFNTLPSALYIGSVGLAEGVIEIVGSTKFHYSELYCRSADGDFRICKSDKNGFNLPSPQVIIGPEDRLISYKDHPGAILAEPGYWRIISSPPKVYQENYDFFYDAFAIIKINAPLHESTLSLYHNNIQTATITFSLVDTYNLFSGETYYGPSKKQLSADIIVGCSLDLSKSLANMGKNVRDGISLSINKQNQQGGINGRLIRVVFMDDQYNPDITRKNIENFIKTYNSNLILCPLGSPTLQACLDLMKQHKIFVFFPITGAGIFRSPDLDSIVHWRASYEAEARVLVRYALREFKSKSFAFLYQDDSYGLAALTEARQERQQAAAQAWLEVPYRRNTISLKDAVDKINQLNPDTLAFFSTATIAQAFIKQYGVDKLMTKHLLGLSDLGETAFKQFVKEKGLMINVSQAVPNIQTSDLEIVKDYKQLLKTHQNLKEDVFMLEGYIGASLFIDIAKKIKGPITHNALITTLKAIQDYHYKGLTLAYDPKTHQLMHTVWIDTGKSQWIEQSTK
jgi:branched-chain amino acid transport system substrate-binding protein